MFFSLGGNLENINLHIEMWFTTIFIQNQWFFAIFFLQNYEIPSLSASDSGPLSACTQIFPSRQPHGKYVLLLGYVL